ncbi:hypothetical protein BJX61DRAFT_125146 [Aspergillus egyptiacus]|nr:hypothetical protein BJX61DRAFT_125146 [Aspergillus egyptiacus]
MRFGKRSRQSSSTAFPPIQTTRRLSQCNLWPVPDDTTQATDGRASLQYHFALPVPKNTPATTDTPIGTVSYVVEATIPTHISGMPYRISRPIAIHRLTVPEPISYRRKYKGDNALTEICYTPHLDSSGPQTASYSVQWLAHSTITPGPRPTEVRYRVARELQWRVDEVVQLLTISHTDRPGAVAGCHRQHVRRLCTGREKGYWIASGGLRHGRQSIEIPFNLSIPPDATVAGDIPSSSYSSHHGPTRECSGETLAITVTHRLSVEVVIGEDTFDQQTGDLVDRRLRVRSFHGAYPLAVRRFIPEDEISVIHAVDVLPPYEAHLPEYV